MKVFFGSVCVILIGLLGEKLLLSTWIWSGLGLFLVAGTAGHFLSRRALDESEPEPELKESRPIGWPIWVFIALTALFLPSLRLLKVSPFWIHLDALAYVLLSLVPALRIACRGGMGERWRNRWPLIPLFLLAIVVGGYALDRIPVTVHGDEGEMGCWAREILRGHVKDLFAPGAWYAIPNFFFGLGAFGMFLFGDNLFGLRMHVFLLGLGAFFFTYLAAEKLWGRRCACFASLVLIGNSYFIHLMRCAVGYTQATFFTSVVFYCFARVYADRRKPGTFAWIHLGGAFMGLGMLSYQANHILPLLWGLLCVFVWAMRRVDWKLGLRAVLGAYAALFFMISPLLILSRVGELPFRNRSEQVVAWSENSMRHLESVYHTGGNRIRIWQEQFKRALLAPTVYPDKSLQYGGPGPILDPVGAGLFMLGVVMACWSVRRVREMFAVLCILPILVLGAALTADAPFYPRIAGVVPMLALVVGRTLDRLLGSVGDSVGRVLRGVYTGVAVVVLAAIVLTNLHLYFQTYRSDRSMHYPVTLMARCIAEQPPETYTYFMVPPEFYLGIGPIRFLAVDRKGEDVTNPAAVIARLPANPGHPILFIVGRHHLNATEQIRQRYPAAKIEEHIHPDGIHMFTSVLVLLEPRVDE
ncbi:MAG: glycosyltransferase family 39 protein [bacterium]